MPFSKEDYYKIIMEDEKENYINNIYNYYPNSLFGPIKYNNNADIFVDDNLYKQQALESTSNMSLFGNNNNITLFNTGGGLFGNNYNNNKPLLFKQGISLFGGTNSLFG